MKFERHVDADDGLSLRVWRAYETSLGRLYRLDLIETRDLFVTRRVVDLVGKNLTIRVERYAPSGELTSAHEYEYHVRQVAPTAIPTQSSTSLSGWGVWLI